MDTFFNCPQNLTRTVYGKAVSSKLVWWSKKKKVPEMHLQQNLKVGCLGDSKQFPSPRYSEFLPNRSLLPFLILKLKAAEHFLRASEGTAKHDTRQVFQNIEGVRWNFCSASCKKLFTLFGEWMLYWNTSNNYSCIIIIIITIFFPYLHFYSWSFATSVYLVVLWTNLWTYYYKIN